MASGLAGALRASLAAIVVLAAGCSSSGGPPKAPKIRLTDVSARARGAHVPSTVALSHVTRAILGPATADSGIPPVRVEPGEGPFEIQVVCPDLLAGQPVLLMVAVLDPAASGRPAPVFLKRRRCPEAGTGASLRLTVARGDSTTPLVATTRIMPVPPSRIEGPAVDLPDEPEVRFAVGGVGAVPADPGPPVPYRVTAVAPDGRALVAGRGLAARDGTWHETVVPLAEARNALGSRVTLVFEYEPPDDDDAMAYVIFGDPTVWGAADPAAPRPWNVLLVSIDTLRADRMSIYGYPTKTTPVLDAVAAAGTVFDQAVTSATWTIPAHATMLTGTNSCVHGLQRLSWDPRPVWRPAPIVGKPLPIGVRPLAELLREAGYETAAFTEDAYVDPGSFHRGFGLFLADAGLGKDATAGLVESTVTSSVKWLRGHADAPFFLFVHTYQVHDPFTPPPPYAAFADRRPFPIRPGSVPPAAGAEADAAKYVAEVMYTDAALAPLFDALDELDLAARTIVVVTSDHGESFGEHAQYGHGTAITEEQLHVPLIWRAPGLIVPGRRIPSLAGLVDVAPTLLELLGLDVPRWMEGVSFAAVLRGAPDMALLLGRALPVESDRARGLRGEAWTGREVAGGFSVVRLDSAGAQTPGAPDDAELARIGWARIQSRCARARDVLGEAAAAPQTGGAVADDPERTRKLRALGYVE